MLSCPWRWLTVYSTSGSNSMALSKSLPTIGLSKTTVSPWLTLEIRSPVWFCTATFLTLGPLAVTRRASAKMPTLSPPITNPKALQKALLGDELVDIRVFWLLRGFDVLWGNDYGFGDILLGLGEAAGEVDPGVLLKLLLPAGRIDGHPEGPGIDRAAGDAEARDVEDVLRCALRVEHEPHHVDLFAHVGGGGRSQVECQRPVSDGEPTGVGTKERERVATSSATSCTTGTATGRLGLDAVEVGAALVGGARGEGAGGQGVRGDQHQHRHQDSKRRPPPAAACRAWARAWARDSGSALRRGRAHPPGRHEETYSTGDQRNGV